MRAQRDVCGIGNSGYLDNAITAMFNVKYHAWVQDSGVSGCINGIFDDSLMNQQKLSAVMYHFSIIVAVAAMLLTYL